MDDEQMDQLLLTLCIANIPMNVLFAFVHERFGDSREQFFKRLLRIHADLLNQFNQLFEKVKSNAPDNTHSEPH